MPELTPVGTMVQPPNVGQALGNLSSIYGIQQQRQNLQTGQYTQDIAQAAAQGARVAARLGGHPPPGRLWGRKESLGGDPP